VDDLPDVRKTLSGLLSDEGCFVRTASNVSEALALLENESFHVAVLDVRLEESNEDNRDGIALMRDIRKRDSSIAIIILTGHADVKMVQEALHPDQNGLSPALYFLEKNEMKDLPRYVQQAYEHVVHQLNTLIADGEKEDVEFKSSIRWDYKKGGVNKEIQLVIGKSIAGMLNYHGGTLLIGIADNGTILGIDQDLVGLRKPDSDGFRLILTEIVRNYLGLEYMEYIHVRFEIVNEKRICVISIESSDKPVFLSSSGISEFWVRVGNSTRQLDVKEATRYIQSHWSKK
jgi:CheY-like chemotaxis protein